MKSIPEALAVMMSGFAPLGPQRLPLQRALGRFLAQDITARLDLPEFDNSAMDGYAVLADDLAQAGPGAPVDLPVKGESRAGGESPRLHEPRTAMRIFTGAQLPPGADAVVVQEQVAVSGGQARFTAPVKRLANVRPRASDVASGSVLLARGTWLGPGELGILAAQGVGAVSVHRQPRVAILSTGDELRDIDEPARPGSIVNSNAYALAAQVQLAGGEPVVLPNVADTLDATVAALEQALTCDLVLTCGGVSVGEYDLVKTAFARVGIAADFWKVRIKPGKPLTFGRKGSVPVVGLPGNPVSAMVTFEALVRPGLRVMCGDPRPYRERHRAVLTEPYRHEAARVELVRATVELVDGVWHATPLRLQGSGSLPSMVNVDALVVLAEGKSEFARGEVVPALLLRDERGSPVSPF